jgi:hypothetical protein
MDGKTHEVSLVICHDAPYNIKIVTYLFKHPHASLNIDFTHTLYATGLAF